MSVASPTTAPHRPGRRPPRPASWRGVAVYAVGVLTLSVLGSLLLAGAADKATSPGALLFVLGPVLMAVALRTLGREGWADAGLRLGHRRRWYLVTALMFPVLTAVVVAVGLLSGGMSPGSGGLSLLVTLTVAGLVPRLLFAAFEEWGWRGYLEPRLAALGVPPLRRHLAVGALWAVWHVPYIVAMGSQYTELHLAVQLPLFVLACLAMAVIWGVARDRTGSVWPAVLGHGVANAIAYPLLDPAVVTIDTPLVLAARPEGLVMLALLVATAAVVQRRWGAAP
ncbi:CPBP family intramembrane glutamic endopeptidase [Cellulomonas sp. S1-8]|uniref:CPBP family intramembrane glutamic endopeptidase n=1 Tax=Cellulomonas sp. S1-8 TaxID=2904790 RepID=UPI0022436DB4|nr:CPBP family intramembrane glutamic endopeptidase [Cellulomonas sp. S1-8]UZN02663.1 CPBP family intramembrane metalloprotease [Cellulomonas sp. S1-8]